MIEVSLSLASDRLIGAVFSLEGMYICPGAPAREENRAYESECATERVRQTAMVNGNQIGSSGMDIEGVLSSTERRTVTPGDPRREFGALWAHLLTQPPWLFYLVT